MKDFIALDDVSQKIQNSAKLLQTVSINALIIGNVGVGKKSLAKYILPNSKIFDARKLQQDIADNAITLNNHSIIIDKINEITNTEMFLKWITDNHIRIIAISNTGTLNQKLKDAFSINIEVPDLQDRVFDKQALIEKFSKEVSNTLDMPLIDTKKLVINISNNTHSLRKSIYFSYLFETIGEEEILMILEKYLGSKVNDESTYKDLLYLFEVPLLKASTEKYKSQVQIAKNLGLNRITLRKKLETHKELL